MPLLTDAEVASIAWLCALLSAMAPHGFLRRCVDRVRRPPSAPALHPSLRISTLSPFQGLLSTAVAALHEHGLQPETVEQVLLHRTEALGTVCFASFPADVRSLAWNLWRCRLARGAQVREVVHDGMLPEGRCLWFVQLRSVGEMPLVVCFVGPDSGTASDFA